MGPNLMLTKNHEATLVAANMIKETVDKDRKTQGMEGNINEDVVIAECMNHGNSNIIDDECGDATEYSSSFGDTMSGDEIGVIVNDCSEVESPPSHMSLAGPLFDGCGDLLGRKRRLTDHWIKFIHPLVWRYKWIEIKLVELKCQALKYERELAQYGQNKQIEEEVECDGFNAMSQIFPTKIQRKEIMKRNKRKQVEDTDDIASYMENHSIFSYYDNKTNNDNGYNVVEIKSNDACPFLQFGDGDNLSEKILCKIEVLHTRTKNLKSRMDKLISGIPQKFSSNNTLTSLVQSDIVNNSANHPNPENGDRNCSPCTSTQHATECHTLDSFMPESAVLGHTEVGRFPDIIRNMTQHLLQLSSDNLIEDDILIPNEAAKEDLRSFGCDISTQMVKSEISMNPQQAVSHVQAHKDNLPVTNSVQQNPESSISKQPDRRGTKGKQKSSLGRWSRRSSG